MTDWARIAEENVFRTFGDRIEIPAKADAVDAFGRVTTALADVPITVAEFGDELNETFVTTNAIDNIVSSDAADTQTVIMEGYTHSLNAVPPPFDTVSRVVQFVDLAGQTPVALDPPLFRCNRVLPLETGSVASPTPALVGQVSIYDSSATAVAGGIPVNDAAVKCRIIAGEQVSYKCTQAVGSDEYWLITGVTASMMRISGSTTLTDIDVEFRLYGSNSWITIESELSLSSSNSLVHVDFAPWRTVPKNADVRMVCRSTNTGTRVVGGIHGILASVVD